jgi:hypothetical protein
MHFIGHTRLYINDIQIYDVVSLDYEHDNGHIGGEISIKLPLLVRIENKNSKYATIPQVKVTEAFKVSDSVKIICSYEGYDDITVFDGFIRDFGQGQPMTIKCMDYQYWWHFGIFGEKNRILVKKNKNSKRTFTAWGNFYKQTTLLNVLNQLVDYVNDTIDATATSAENITLISEKVPDITLVNLTFANMSPAAILQWLKEKLGLCITMIGTQLFCSVANTVSKTYILKSGNPNDFINDGGNILKCNIQKSYAAFSRFRVEVNYLLDDGRKQVLKFGDLNGETHQFFYYNLKYDAAKFEQIGIDCLNKCKQNVFTGDFHLMLYPFISVYDEVQYTRDFRFPERQANYVVTGKKFTATTTGGYRQILKVAFLSNG